MQRLKSLDWLRGLMAMSILLFHCVLFTEIPWATDAGSILGRLGVYGVSIFFVLSGLSMAHVYDCSLVGQKSMYRFFTLRAFRIWPLLTLIVAILAVKASVAGAPIALPVLISNATGAFGFYAPSNYIATGAWSIGNELVFYALFPIFLWAFQRNGLIGSMMLIISCTIAAVFAFNLLQPEISLGEQWRLYVNPFNNLVLFVAGIWLFYQFRHWAPSLAVRAALFAVPIALFAFWPAAGDLIHITTGATRFVFIAASVAFVLAFYRGQLLLPRSIAKMLEWLGMISYGLYLIHPLLIPIVSKLPRVFEATPIVFIVIVAVLTLATAHIVYVAVERPMMKLGKKLTTPLN